MGSPLPPKKSGPNIGLILGIGCVGLLVLGGIGAGVAVYFTRKAATTIATTLSSATAITPTGTGGSTNPVFPSAGDLKAEVVDMRHYKADYGKARHFIGEIVNTGTAPIGFLSVKVTLFDASNTAVDSGTCTSIFRTLEPGEKVPCALTVFKGENFTTFKTEVKPQPAYLRGSPAKLEITDIKLTPKRGYQPYQVEGKITNKDSFKAKNVWVIASLYNAQNKIVGADQTIIAGNDLDPGQGALFTAKIYNVAEKPETYKVKAVGYGD